MSTIGLDAEVVIVGAGAAGLAAAQTLAAAGIRPCVLEARDRTGGRIYTAHVPGLAAPLELGAEFVHGVPEELAAPARAGVYTLDETGGRPWQFRAGALRPAAGWASQTGEIFERLYEVAATGADMSFQHFLERYCAEERLAAARTQALAYIQGYQAAHAERIGIQGLVKGEEADDAVHSERSSRVRGGYDRVVAWLQAGISASLGTLRLNTVVTEVCWQPGRVELLCRPAGADGTDLPKTIAARCAIVTLPLGVLQQPPDAPGAVRFTPAIPETAAALDKLHMGSVVKVVLHFREPFWAGALGGRSGRGGHKARDGHHGPTTRAPLGFLRAPEERIPTWWTLAPDPAPVLTGWTGGPNAEQLATLTDAELREVSLAALGHIFGGMGGRRYVESLLVGWHYHNWQRDPFARGAYSYVGVDGLAAQEALAQPVEDTLFFAGEATEYQGHFSTVHGAIVTGRRAARQALASLGRPAATPG